MYGTQRSLNRSQCGMYQTQRIAMQVRCLPKFEGTASPELIK